MTLIKHCAGWMRTKTGMLIVLGLIVGIIAVERSVGGALLAGATPLVMMAACLVPCAIPLLLLRRRAPKANAPALSPAQAVTCGCSDPQCGTPPVAGTTE